MLRSVDAAGKRSELALELADLGAETVVAQLRRKYPERSNDLIEQELKKWFQTRPGAAHGDCDGVVVP